MKKKRSYPSEVAKIYRKASQKDIDIWSAERKEEPMKVRLVNLRLHKTRNENIRY
jgi:hypothetical protein